MPCLKKISGDKYEMISLPEGTTTIGRSSHCNLVFSSPVVSKLQAVIECVPGKCTLRNESSKGTAVNGKKTKETVTLVNGDSIRIGLEHLIFYYGCVDDVEAQLSSGNYLPIKLEQDDSIQHKSAPPGKLLNLTEPIHDISDRIRARISFRDQTVASLAMTDSARKLSQSLRLSRTLRQAADEGDFNPVYEMFYQLFPQTTQMVIVEATRDNADIFRISDTHRRTEDTGRAIACEDAIVLSARRNEGLLLADQWRECPDEKPRLSELNLISILCAPIQCVKGGCSGVVQLIAEIPNPEFDISDLERLTILAQFYSIILPLRHP